MSITQEIFAAWMEKYGRAWEARDAEAAADLYAENGTYQVTPFVEPMQGRPAIFEYWTHVAQTEENIQFGFEILAVTPEQGIARWWGFVCNRVSKAEDQAGRHLRYQFG